MLKKLLALTAGAVFSMNASAGYIQYDFSGPLSGYIIEHTEDSSVAYYNLNVFGQHINAHFFPSGSFDNLTGESLNSNLPAGGPVNFSAFDNLTDYYVEYLNVAVFSVSPGQYIYGAGYSQTRIPDLPPYAEYFPVNTGFQGTITASAVSDTFAAQLDAQGGYADGISPGAPVVRQVPEPASLALLAIGAIGAARFSRRRKDRR